MATSDGNLFSTGYAEEKPASWGPEIEKAFQELRRITSGEVRCVRWNDGYVAAAFTVPVDLPSRGPVGGVDIRAQEPILLVFSQRDYPERAPLVRSDRKDFPVSVLPHLNAVKADQPPWLCMHRGSFDDWFAEHTLEDLVRRAMDWLRDAATNRLIHSEDYFEPTRLTDLAGTAVFSPQTFKKWVEKGWKSTGGEPGYGFLAMKLLDPDNYDQVRDGSFPVRALSFHPKEKDLSKLHDAIVELNSIVAKNENLAPWCFGILCWTARSRPVMEYFGHLPREASGLLELCRHLDIPINEALREYASRNLALLKGMPIILGVVRPRKLINSNSNIEPLCFVTNGSAPEFAEKGILPGDALTVSLSHRSPLTPDAAKEISGIGDNDRLGRVLLFGCGALGSKIGLHFGRSGHTALTTVDHDSLSPHNFVRHALLPDRTGQNKAEATKKSIEAIYEGIPEPLAPIASTGSALDWLKGEHKDKLAEHDLLLDATASGMVFEATVRAALPGKIKVARCGIADLGRVGILSIEGHGRNPRIDDLNVLVSDIAMDLPPLRKWLERERGQREERVGAALEEIAIGLSCASDTMRLADDVVSWHASTFSIALRELFAANHKFAGGHLILNYRAGADDNPAGESLVSQRIPVDPVLVLPSHSIKGWRMSGEESWQIRIRAHVAKEMRERLIHAAPKETGGLMIGVIHSKRRIIYVTRIMDPPPDSEGTYSGFRRGTRRLPQTVNRIKKASGDLLGFVGDWHTHPRGSGRISSTDVNAMMRTKRDFDTAGMPTFILIVSHKGFNAYVSTPE
jgi:integrative and conjugative element protein (TIGR02256 family)